MAIQANIIQAEDSLIARKRLGRKLLFLLAPVVLTCLGALIAGALATVFLGGGPFFLIGLVVGAVLGFVAFLSLKHLFVVQNDTTSLLVTLDRARSLLGLKGVDVVYGPGTHFAYPWEQRFAENNIPLKEVAEEFSFQVICKDGTLLVTASFRLRPDFQNPIAYLSGVGAAAEDFKALVITAIVKLLTPLTMLEARAQMNDVNIALHTEFVDKDSDFEKRFGVRSGDVTVSNMLMSDEAQRTLSGLNEAATVAKGTAILLGYETVEAMQEALKEGVISQADIDRARREFRIISGNMDGAEVKRYEVDITGLTPEAASAITSLLNNPAARQFMSGGSKGGNQPPKKGTKP